MKGLAIRVKNREYLNTKANRIYSLISVFSRNKTGNKKQALIKNLMGVSL